MKQIPNYPNPPPPGLNETVEAAGIILVNEGGLRWLASDPDKAQAIADAYDPSVHVKAEKAAELADARWQKETGGFMFQPSGADRPYLFVSTREAMGPVMGAVLAVQSGVFPDPTMWKTAEPGAVFVPITTADVVPLFKAFAAHVAGAFMDESVKQQAVKDERDWMKISPIKIDVAAVEAVPAVEP
jgi:hypothetical protein